VHDAWVSGGVEDFAAGFHGRCITVQAGHNPAIGKKSVCWQMFSWGEYSAQTFKNKARFFRGFMQ
jgi:hypothetical protein